MKHAFDKAGFDRLRFELRAVAPRFTLEEWIAIHDEATKGKLGEGPMVAVRKDHEPPADAQPPMPEGQNRSVREDQLLIADGHPIASEGHCTGAKSSNGPLPSARDSLSPMPGEGHRHNVREDSIEVAAARLPIAGGGRPPPASQGHIGLAPSRVPIASGEARSGAPEKADGALPPAREPSDAFRQALARDRIQTNRIWLDTHRTSDGRYWSAVHPREFPGMKRDGVVAAVIEKVYGPFNAKQMNTPLSELITPAMEKRIVRALEQQNAA